MQLLSAVNSRLLFEISDALLEGTDLKASEVVLTESYLRIEVLLATNQTNYRFPFLNNQNNNAGVIYNTEQRLNQQDSFIVGSWGMFLAKAASAVDTEFDLHSYPNQIVFPTGAGPLRTVYNGNLRLTVNNRVLVPAMDTMQFFKAGQTQQTAALGAGSPQDQFDGSVDGLIPLGRPPVIIGSKNSELVLNLPAAISAVDANTRLVMLLRGALAQNSTIVT